MIHGMATVRLMAKYAAVTASIGAAVATAMKTMPTNPTEFALRCCTSGAGLSDMRILPSVCLRLSGRDEEPAQSRGSVRLAAG